MVDADILAAKLAELERRLARVTALAPVSEAELRADPDRLDLVSFNLMLAIQVCVDVASHVIADEGWSAPVTLAESFVRLREHAVISAGTAQALGRAVGFRNVVAHGYAGVELAAVHAGATAGREELCQFAREIAAWIGKQLRG